MRLVAKQPDPTIVQHLQSLLKDALEGRVIGFIAAVHYGGRDFAYLGTGSMCDCPTLGIASAHKLATKMLHNNS